MSTNKNLENCTKATTERTPQVGDWVRVKGVNIIYKVREIAEWGGDVYYRETPGCSRVSYEANFLELVSTGEEARRSAEPVPPAGVTVYEKFVSFAKGGDQWSLTVKPDGSFLNGAITPERLEYVAALSRYRASQHAVLSEAVTAAEEALYRVRTQQTLVMNQARFAIRDAEKALDAARKEAGL